MNLPWYECDTRFIAAHYQPATLIDLALSREVDSHRLLRGTGLFHDDILAGQLRISAQQFIRLIDNSQRELAADDSSFLFGQRLLPGHYDAASHALRHAGSLYDALTLLVRQRAVLSPLLAPRLLVDEQHAYLYWLDACGAGEQQRFLVEASMTAVSAASRWLSGERLPWHYQFIHAKPRYIEQYWLNLGEHVQFERQVNVMSIARDYLHRPWPQASATVSRVAQQNAEEQQRELGVQASLLDHLYDHLQSNIRQPLQLEAVALAFDMSPATLKRKLQKHGTHFQEQLDLARKHVALYLYQVKGYSNEEVASYLQFHDTTNFRRSFKRWTGFSPSALLQLLGN
ncbi:AraC family transcriptional regulator [Pseudomonas sp. GD03944]|uniref:AraC family transcriptional regulator n=1 Tax=Pseudomonas sp. GD03944 TaxID=2975409 RepID=UPI00244A0A31|nr:AraC family transcriptional regulator [Pseudomonas sp. GD03944]MDH1263133.1 AraC family transcriptional regulator [Pseudomonas sp. GD03944]